MPWVFRVGTAFESGNPPRETIQSGSSTELVENRTVLQHRSSGRCRLLRRAIEPHRVRRHVAQHDRAVAVEDVCERRPVRQGNAALNDIAETNLARDLCLKGPVAEHGRVYETYRHFFMSQRAI